jgi:hypothetical protein
MEIRNIIRCLPFILFIVDVWWKHYGGKLPELQELVVRLLSQTCSSSGCERNWSVFEKIHSKIKKCNNQNLNCLYFFNFNFHNLVFTIYLPSLTIALNVHIG